LTDPAPPPSPPEDHSTKACATTQRRLGAKTLVGLALAIILMVLHWIGVRQAIDNVPQQTPATATEQLIKAVLDHNTEATRLALTELGEQTDSRWLTVPKAALEGHLSPAQRRKLREHQEPYSLLAVSLAASDHSTAALLLDRGHLFSSQDRYLLASALAQANLEQLQRWRGLMIELSQYRDRRLRAMENQGSRTVDDKVITAVLRQQGEFSPIFGEDDAGQALAQCDAAALGFILSQDKKQGQAWHLELDPVFRRLLEKDMAKLTPGEADISDMSDEEAGACVAAARLLVNLSHLTGEGEGQASPANTVGSLALDARAENIAKVMNASDSQIINSLRTGAGLGDFDDAHFDLAHTQQFLEKNPPFYPYSLQIVAQMMEKSPSAQMLQIVLQRPTLYFFHRAFQKDTRLALRNWNAHATEALRRELHDDFNNRQQLAMVFTGKARAKQTEAIHQWLADAGLSCRPTPLKGAQGYPGTAWLHFGCS